MEDNTQKKRSRKKRTKQEQARRMKVGAGVGMVFEKIYGSGDNKISPFELALRQEHQAALRGDRIAMDNMIRMLLANMEAREAYMEEEEQRERENRESWHEPPKLDNADVALLILGIGAVDNQAMEKLGGLGKRAYDAQLKALRPNAIEPWVVEAARARCDGATKVRSSSLKSAPFITDEAEISDWRARKRDLVDDLIRLRGPGSTQFAKGKSGNPYGRPRTKFAEFPYDGFFMEPVQFTANGKVHVITRLDAFFNHLVILAAKGDRKVGRLVMQKLMRMYQRQFKQRNEDPGEAEIVRG